MTLQDTPRLIPTLRVSDYGKARTFYVERLGFTVEWEHQFGPDLPVFAEITRDSMSLFLSEHQGDCPTGALIHFQVANLDEWYAEFLRRDVPVHALRTAAMQGLRNLTLTDPDGNKLRFFTRLADWRRDAPSDRRQRRVDRTGIFGRASRIAIGGWLAGSVALGHTTGPFRPAPGVLGLLIMPLLILGWQWLRARRNPGRLEATGMVASAFHLFLFAGMLAVPQLVPSLWFTSDAALLFYGASTLIAAVRRRTGCEVLAFPNWVLGRDDQWGCLIFTPFDRMDERLQRP